MRAGHHSEASERWSPGPLSQGLFERRDEILEVTRSYGATNVRVFGSIARGDETDTSDIDLLVDLPEGEAPLVVVDLAGALSALLGRTVDVATPALLREVIRDEVLSSAIPL